MCTPNYIRSDSQRTDLSFYSLKLNSNIPTTYTTTKPLGYTPFLGFTTQKPAAVNLPAASTAAHTLANAAALAGVSAGLPSHSGAPQQHVFGSLSSNGSSSASSANSASSARSGSSSSASSLSSAGSAPSSPSSVSSTTTATLATSAAPTAAGAGFTRPMAFPGSGLPSSGAGLALPPYRNKLDLLVQTATTLEPLLPSTPQPATQCYPGPRPPSLSSSHSSSASLPLPLTPGAGADDRTYGAHGHGHDHAHGYSHGQSHFHVHLQDSSSSSCSDDGVTAAADGELLHHKRPHSPPVAIKLASPSVSTKRQRSGPSCDCCRSRKIKCDSEIVILAELPRDLPLPPEGGVESEIAHCEFVTLDPATGYQYFRIIKSPDESQRHKLGHFSYLKFKPCTACSGKKLNCRFSKGFTRNDIIKFNKTERLHHVDHPNSGKRASKKTSCAMCRFKKIKCIKIDGASACMNCTRKLLDCSFE